MNAREIAEELLGGLLCRQEDKTDKINDFVDNLIAAVKEEITPPSKLRPYQQKAIDDLRESFKEPQLIQGYTAEQWQEIIDGGYLCEFRDKPGRWVYGLLASCSSDGENYYFIQDGIGGKKFCRPAQIKGVMRPIFVEPVDKEAWCHFFLGRDRVRLGEWSDASGLASSSGATKYIEL